MKPVLLPLGDSAVLVRFGDDINAAVNQHVHALTALLYVDKPAGVIETIPAYATLLIHYDPLALTYAQASSWINQQMDKVNSAVSRKPRRVEVPVRYGGEQGPDLDFVAFYHQLSVQEVLRIHSGRKYIVYMMGFTPGFPYMGKLEDSIATPRLETPRTHVAAGSVGIAGAQTGIYPIDSPGGWRLIGRTGLQLFDPKAESPFLFSPGDTVQFVIEALDA